MMCENCRWRGAHYRCVGFKQLPRAPWYCFRCEDYKTRVSQREVMPVLDARVHDEYGGRSTLCLCLCVHVYFCGFYCMLVVRGGATDGRCCGRYLATAFPRKRVAVSRQDDAGDFEEEMVGSGGMAPSAGAASSDATLVTYAARPELDAMLRSAVDLHIFGGDEPAAAVAAGLVCRACHEVHEIRCNFCASCGAPMSISKCFTDRVVAEQSLQPAARRHVFISYKGLVAPSIAVYDTGEVRLAQVHNLVAYVCVCVLSLIVCAVFGRSPLRRASCCLSCARAIRRPFVGSERRMRTTTIKESSPFSSWLCGAYRGSD